MEEDNLKDQSNKGFVLLSSSIRYPETKKERKGPGRPKGADISKQLILQAFVWKSEELLDQMKQKWGFPVSPQLWNDPELQKDDHKWRNPSLTSNEIRQKTGLSKRRLIFLLRELVSPSDSSLSVSSDGRAKIYRPRSLDECGKRVTLYGPRKKAQFQRLLKLGLDVIWATNGRGRPKRFPLIRDDATLNQDKGMMLLGELMTLIGKDNRQAVVSVASSSGMKFGGSGRIWTFSWRGNQRDQIEKAIKQLKRLRQSKSEIRKRLGGADPSQKEVGEILRSAGLGR